MNARSANFALPKLPANATPEETTRYLTQFSREMDMFVNKLNSELSARSVGGIVPIGGLIDYGGTTAPDNWVFAFGQLLNIVDYEELFTAYSTTYGGNGTTTFGVPDCRERVIIGKADMGGSSPDPRRLGTSALHSITSTTLGSAGGVESHVLTEAQLAAHKHTLTTRYANGGSTTAATWWDNCSTSARVVDTSTVGSGEAHNNVQPGIILNKIIRCR